MVASSVVPSGKNFLMCIAGVHSLVGVCVNVTYDFCPLNSENITRMYGHFVCSGLALCMCSPYLDL